MPNNNSATNYWKIDTGTSSTTSSVYYSYTKPLNYIPNQDNNAEKVVEKPLPKDRQLHVVFKIKKDE